RRHRLPPRQLPAGVLASRTDRCGGANHRSRAAGAVLMSVEREKRLAAEAAAELVEDGMTVGLGTGSTVAFLLPALAARGLDLRCVSTSPRTEEAARELGMGIEPFVGTDALPQLDIAIDGAD